MRRFLGLCLAALAALPWPVIGQGTVVDSTCYLPLKAAVDSLGKLHLASTVTTAYQRRAIRTLSDAHTSYCTRPVPPPPDTTPRLDAIALSVDHITTPYWSTGALGVVDAAGQATVCATVDVQNVRYLAESPVQVTRVRDDSLAFTVRPERDGSGLWLLCEPIVPGGAAMAHRQWPVRWVLARVGGVLLPVAEAVP